MNSKILFRRIALFLSVLSCFAATVFISSCSKDEEGIPNQLIIDGTIYSLSKGYISGYGVEEDANGNLGSIYEVLFISSGLTFDGEELSGTGQILYMALFSRSTIELAAGTYEVNDGFLEGSVLESFAGNGNFTTGAVSGYSVEEGTLTISRSGNNWVFQFDFTASSGTGSSVTVKGSFSGTLGVVE